MKFDFKELDELFDSATIKPSFDYIHVILALYLFGELDEQEGIGRYRLREELLIGAGTAKSLITKLNKKIGFISVISNKNQKKGHRLTEKGKKFLEKIKQIIPIIKEGDLSILKDIIIETNNMSSYFCLVRNAGSKIKDGIDQRDAAIKVNGSGSTCLIYNGKQFIFPRGAFLENENEQVDVSKKVQDYFKAQLEGIELKNNDVLIIGLGENSKNARLASLNAALTLI